MEHWSLKRYFSEIFVGHTAWYIMLSLTCLSTLLSLAQAQSVCSPLNLGFEADTGWRIVPVVGNQGFVTFITDPSQAHSGNGSLFIHRPFSGSGDISGVRRTIPGAPLAGKTVTLSGYIKTQYVADGQAELWWHDAQSQLGLGSVPTQSARTQGAKGTQGWKRYSLTVKVDPKAITASFGASMSGAGMAWFDDLHITVGPNHVPVEQVLKVSRFQPTATQLDWLKRNAIPLSGSNPDQGFGDLMPLKAMINNTRIVGLGGATHGSHEIFQMKDRLVRFLTTQVGFTIFAIEANMPEAYRLNQYVLHGQGNPKKLVEGMGFWTWDTQEVLNMVKWMHKYNASGKGKIEFTGFDMQNPILAMQEVSNFVQKVDPDYLQTLNSAYQVVGNTFNTTKNGVQASTPQVEQWKDVAQKVYKHLKAKQKAYLSKASPSAVAWAIQNARIVLQGAEEYLPDGPSRDESMAESIEWIAKQNPDAKIVLWAHDAHIAKSQFAMGGYLAAHFGKDYIALGTAFYQGGYNAGGRRGLTAYTAPPACPGTIGATFHAIGEPVFLMDLHQVASSPQGAWLDKPQWFRTLGSAAGPGYASIVLAKAFDLVVFIDKVTASHFLQ